jgi:hypothetical protein
MCLNFQRRLARLAQLGKDVMMTEFDIQWEDEIVRGDWMEDAFRAFFASPHLKGVILWDFWNKTMSYPDKGLVADDYSVSGRCELLCF